MTAAELGDIAVFPFLEPPDRSQINDGLRLLTELGALAEGGRGARTRLTKVGRRLAAVPVDPRLGRMLLAAERQGCLRGDVDHRRRTVHQSTPGSVRPSTGSGPTPCTGASGPSTTRPESAASDFLAFLNLWDYLRESQRELSGNAFRRRCREEFLHLLRVREWQDLHAQLSRSAREIESAAQRCAGRAGADPHRGARRPVVPRGAGGGEGRNRPRAAPGTGTAAGVPRRPRHPVRDQSRAPAWPGSHRRWWWPPRSPRPPGSGPGRSHRSPPSRSRRSARTCSRGSTRNRTGRPAQAAVMAYETGQPVRRADRRPPPGRVRLDQAGRGPGDLPPLRVGRGPVADPSPVLPGQAASCGPRPRSWRSGPGGGTWWSTTKRSGDFYEARMPVGITSGCALRQLVEAGPAGPIPTCSRMTMVGPDGDPTERARSHRLSGRLAGGRSGAGRGLRVRRPGTATTG